MGIRALLRAVLIRMAMITCPTCDGSGTYINGRGNRVTCYSCGGSGEIDR